MRDEIYGSFNHELSPTFAAGYWVAPALKIRASVSRAFRLPSYTDLYYHDPANVGSPNLRPESAWSYEGGLDWNAGGRCARQRSRSFKAANGTASTTFAATPNDIWRATNFQRLQFTGVEAEVAIRPASNRTRSNWQYTGLARRPGRNWCTGIKVRLQLPRPFRHSLLAGSIPRGLLARTRIGALQRYQRDPYGLWDIYAASNRHRIRPFLQLSNLTNTSYEEIPSVAMPGRSILGGFELLVFGSR